MGKYTIKDIESRAEVLKNDVDNIYRALHTKLGKSPGTLDQVPQSILDIPEPPTQEPLTITPSADRQEFYTSDEKKYNPITVHAVTSAIDSNIQPENIKEGVSILGVAGTLSGGGGSDVFVVPDGVKFGYSTFSEIPSNWDFSNVIDMSSMFGKCSNLTTVSQLNALSAINLKEMFAQCYNLTTINSLDLPKASNVSYMFYSCSKLTTITLLNTANVTDFSHTFDSCSKLTTITLLNTAKASNVSYIFTACNNLTTVEGIDFSGLTSELTRLFGYNTSMPKITRFIVNGKINVSISDDYSIKAMSSIDYDSVKSILAAADRTDNTNAKTLAFNRTMTDQNGELATLVSSCTSKGWTITGLTLQ